MNRTFAILFAGILVGLVVVVAATEQNRPSGPFDTTMLATCLIAQVVLVVGLLWYCGFAALHSTQYLASPRDRSAWLLMIVGLNVLGACYYFLTRYQSFRKEGKGRLMSFKA